MPSKGTGYPDRFAILPSDYYKFGVEPPINRFEVVARTRIPDGTIVLAVNAGLIAFDFTDSDLAGAKLLNPPDTYESLSDTMDGLDRILELQGARMRIATFVTACIYGYHACATHSSVRDALFPGLDEIYDWVERTPGTFDVVGGAVPLLVSRLSLSRARPEFIPHEHLKAGFELATRMLDARSLYHATDPVSLIVMTYQAMILHNRQHAGASVALLALVAEAALEELLYVAGLIDGIAPRTPSATAMTTMSANAARKLKFKGRIDALLDAKVLSTYLRDRLEELRETRNALMHEGQDAKPGQSGTGLTAIRDLLRLCTGEDNFELNMGWSYRY